MCVFLFDDICSFAEFSGDCQLSQGNYPKQGDSPLNTERKISQWILGRKKIRALFKITHR